MLKGNRKKNIYQFPESEKVTISKSDLHIILHKYSQVVQMKFTVFDALAIVGLWSPVLSGGFTNFFGLNPEAVKGGYFVAASMLSLFIFYSKFFKKSDEDISTDPEEMATKIIEQCK